MTDKEIINELNRIRNSGVSILGKTALRLAMEKIEKLEKIEQIINEYNNGNDMEYEYLAKIREVLDNE